MSEQQQMKVAVCLIVTRKYHVFCQPLIDSICKYFLLRHKIEVNIFTDNTELEYVGDERVTIVKHPIPSYGFPEATLFRYSTMCCIEYDCDYIYYLDVDYLIVSEIDEEFFGDIVAVLHPGFMNMGGGSWCTDKNSLAYTFEHDRIKYFAGGTQGGRKDYYYAIMKRLRDWIDDDEKRGVRAVHNDESHWNAIVPLIKNPKILDSSYCFVQQPHLQKAWKIDHLTPRIIALEKIHSEIRS